MTQSHSPETVTDGLVSYWDAGNIKSYPKTGSTWTDLKPTTNITLSGSPTFSSNNKGYLSFASASSQYGTATSSGDLATWTVECFVRFTASYSSKVSTIICGQFNGSNKFNFSIGTNNSPNNYNIAVGFFDGAWHNTTGITYAQNQWFHITGSYDGATIKQFTNGTLVDSLNYAGTPSSGGEWRINRRWDDVVSSGNLFDIDLAALRIYNRALTNAEIIQNYNSIRGRFGI